LVNYCFSLSLTLRAKSLDVDDHVIPQFSVPCSLYQLYFLMFHSSFLQSSLHTGHPCHSPSTSTPLPHYLSCPTQVFQTIYSYDVTKEIQLPGSYIINQLSLHLSSAEYIFNTYFVKNITDKNFAGQPLTPPQKFAVVTSLAPTLLLL